MVHLLMSGRQRRRNGEAAEWREAGWVPLGRVQVNFHSEKQNKELLTVM